MKVYVQYLDNDNSCGDPDCCGGPCPSPHVKIFSSLEKVKEAGIQVDRVTEVEVDNNEFEYVG